MGRPHVVDHHLAVLKPKEKIIAEPLVQGRGRRTESYGTHAGGRERGRGEGGARLWGKGGRAGLTDGGPEVTEGGEVFLVRGCASRWPLWMTMRRPGWRWRWRLGDCVGK